MMRIIKRLNSVIFEPFSKLEQTNGKKNDLNYKPTLHKKNLNLNHCSALVSLKNNNN